MAGLALGMSAPAQAGSGAKDAALGAGIGALGGALISNGDTNTTVGGAVIGGLLGYGLSGDSGKKKVVEHHHHHYVSKDRPGPRRHKHDNGRRRHGRD
ncbi:MAG TPA: hypothetical protein VED40_09660 [Azospirillaceae bacterium]|nr:hypothetical protein [Azospirillaceae bacterium]